jgi:hypothetical protein
MEGASYGSMNVEHGLARPGRPLVASGGAQGRVSRRSFGCPGDLPVTPSHVPNPPHGLGGAALLNGRDTVGTGRDTSDE